MNGVLIPMLNHHNANKNVQIKLILSHLIMINIMPEVSISLNTMLELFSQKLCKMDQSLLLSRFTVIS